MLKQRTLNCEEKSSKRKAVTVSRLAKLFVLVPLLANVACEFDPLGGWGSCFFQCPVSLPANGNFAEIITGSSVWGSSATDVFAVGLGGRILHYDGNTWSAQASGRAVWLKGVWGSSATDVFAVGEDSTILHYDGSDWRR